MAWSELPNPGALLHEYDRFYVTPGIVPNGCTIHRLTAQLTIWTLTHLPVRLFSPITVNNPTNTAEHALMI